MSACVQISEYVSADPRVQVLGTLELEIQVSVSVSNQYTQLTLPLFLFCRATAVGVSTLQACTLKEYLKFPCCMIVRMASAQ